MYVTVRRSNKKFMTWLKALMTSSVIFFIVLIKQREIGERR